MMDRDDFVFLVFSTDPRVKEFVHLKWELPRNTLVMDYENKLKKALYEAYRMAKEGKAPLAEWLNEAEILSERLGKDWRETPQPTLVEALAKRERLVPFPFHPTHVMSGETAMLSMTPMTTCAGRRLILGHPRVAECLSVLDIKSSNLCYFHSMGEIPGRFFSTDAFPFWLSMDHVFPGQSVIVTVRNDYGAEVFVQAVLLGLVKEEQ
jgi:hypothetical protein